MTRAPANTSKEEQDMRAVIDGWARERWGQDLRVLHELVLGDRRIDMLIVAKADIIGIEVKGPRDQLNERLAAQIREFNFYVPELWLIVAAKWEEHQALYRAGWHTNTALVRGNQVEVAKKLRDRRAAKRDDLCCSRLLELLWNSETLAIAKRSRCAYEFAPGKRFPIPRIKSMIARMLSGHEIVKEVCTELRSRPLVGMQSDAPLHGRGEDGKEVAPQGLQPTRLGASKTLIGSRGANTAGPSQGRP